ncbi:serine/threonine-protein kinase pim-1-like [Archocentrus centrarchus]|uniref:serine/threonine-protein kinase pim-1-like n=1 Tax=Archocentrus centrarchus TaxID=63155 RepID=UPI0011EA07F9|nr:serine/threonine-protein kinase pim-1-like [Archocentrus centrarchus]
MFKKFIKVELRRIDELPDTSMNSAGDCMVRGQKRKVSGDDEGCFRPAKERKLFHHVLNDEEQASSSVEKSKDPKTKMFKKFIKVELRRIDELPDTSMNSAGDCMVRGQKRKVSGDDEGCFRPAKERKLFHHVLNDEEQASSSVEKSKDCSNRNSLAQSSKRKATSDGKASLAKKLKSLDQEEIKKSVSVCSGEFKAKYVELHKLGRGGFGTVFAGYRKEDNFPVAIKHISKRCVPIKAKAENGKQISVEVAAMLKLAAGTPGSSATVSLLDWFELRKKLILVMERPVPAVDLDKYIEANADTITEETAKVILKQVIEAVKELEDKNVFHRDIKTDNILIESGSDVPRVRLIDFGVSCFCNERSRYSVFCGTPAYCPPEWLIHKSYRPGPTTVWQLGVVLYETLHEGAVFNTKLFLKEKLKISEELSENCQDFLKMCFNLDPKRRPKLKDLLRHRWFR